MCFGFIYTIVLKLGQVLQNTAVYFIQIIFTQIHAQGQVNSILC